MKSHKIAHRPPKPPRSSVKKSAGKEKCLVISNQSKPASSGPLITSPRPSAALLGNARFPIALKLRAPAAKEVFVAGSFNGWQVGATPLRSLQDGEWQGELKLTPGRYEYLFVVDGSWLPDPAAREAAPNPFGGWNSVLSVN